MASTFQPPQPRLSIFTEGFRSTTRSCKLKQENFKKLAAAGMPKGMPRWRSSAKRLPRFSQMAATRHSTADKRRKLHNPSRSCQRARSHQNFTCCLLACKVTLLPLILQEEAGWPPPARQSCWLFYISSRTVRAPLPQGEPLQCTSVQKNEFRLFPLASEMTRAVDCRPRPLPNRFLIRLNSLKRQPSNTW